MDYDKSNDESLQMCNLLLPSVKRSPEREKANARLIDVESAIGTWSFMKNKSEPAWRLSLESLNKSNNIIQENRVREVSSSNNNLNLNHQHLLELKSQNIPVGLKHVLINYKYTIQDVNFT